MKYDACPFCEKQYDAPITLRKGYYTCPHCGTEYVNTRDEHEQTGG